MKRIRACSVNEVETIRIGRSIGERLKGGEVIELVSDLGGGKTTLTKGLVEGVGSDGLVSSPTFTISNIYASDTLTVYHYDFYRLGELGLMSEELEETLADPTAVTIIEWAGSASNRLPTERLIRIDIQLVNEDEDSRTIDIEIADALNEVHDSLELHAC